MPVIEVAPRREDEDELAAALGVEILNEDGDPHEDISAEVEALAGIDVVEYVSAMGKHNEPLVFPIHRLSGTLIPTWYRCYLLRSSLSMR